MSRSCRGHLEKRKQKPQSTKRKPPKEGNTAQQPQGIKRQTPIAVISIKEPLPTTAPRGKETQHKGQDYQNSKTKGTSGGAEAPKH